MNIRNAVAHAVIAQKDECRVERINPHTKKINSVLFEFPLCTQIGSLNFSYDEC